jgi:hypothetical protein
MDDEFNQTLETMKTRIDAMQTRILARIDAMETKLLGVIREFSESASDEY